MLHIFTKIGKLNVNLKFHKRCSINKKNLKNYDNLHYICSDHQSYLQTQFVYLKINCI